jgi:hypothetical protein
MPCRAAIAVCFVLIAPALALAQGAPASPPAAPSAAPAEPATEQTNTMDPPAVGDHWTYELHDDITGQLKNNTTMTITDVTANEIAVRFEITGYPAYVLVYDHDWNTKSDNIWKYTPNNGTGVKLPLRVGATWKFQGDEFNSTHNVNFKLTGSSKVVEQETITTSAGTFDTFKIETTMSAHNTNDATKNAQSTMTTWYAPAVDHWVKRTSKQMSNGHVNGSSTVELVDYGRR